MRKRRLACFEIQTIEDMLFLLPVLHNLRTGIPDSYIAVVADPESTKLLRITELADEIIVRKQKNFFSELSNAFNFTLFHPQTSIFLSRTSASGVYRLLSGSKYNVGFEDAPLASLFTTKINWENKPKTENYLAVLKAMGCRIEKKDYVGLVTPGISERNDARLLFRSAWINIDEPYAVLGPGGPIVKDPRSWSDIGFAQVADYLKERYGLKSVIVGPDSCDLISGLSKNVIDICGRVPTATMSAVLECASIFVGVDSWIMHLAAALSKPVVAIFGTTDPEIYGPQGDMNRIVKPDYSYHGGDYSSERRCMEDISPGMVNNAIDQLME